MIGFSLDLISANQIIRILTTRGPRLATRVTFSLGADYLQVCSLAGEAGRRHRNRQRTTFWRRDWRRAQEVAAPAGKLEAERCLRRDRTREIPCTYTLADDPHGPEPAATLRDHHHPVQLARATRICNLTVK